MNIRHNDRTFLYIDSGNSLDSATNTFTTALQVIDPTKYDRCVVTQMSVPISYYLVESGFNTLTLKENNSTATVTLPAGNYNSLSFATVMMGLLNAASPNSLTYVISSPDGSSQNNTGLFTYKVNTNTITCSFVFSASNTLNELFGFNRGITATFVAIGGSSFLTSTNVVNFTPESTVFLHSSIVDAENSDVLQECYFGNNVVLALQTFLNPCPYQTSKRFIPSKGASFSITNESGIPIYLNGVNLTFTLMLYKDVEQQFYDDVRKYMKWKVENHTELQVVPAEENLNPDEIQS